MVMNFINQKNKYNINDCRGFSLIGALIGMVIFVVGILAVFAMQTQSLTSTGKSTIRSTETTWAQDAMEMFTSLPYDDPELNASNDPLEPVNTAPAGFHQESRGPYTITWVVFTSVQNGKTINDYAKIKDLTMFNNVKKTQQFKDIPDNTKLVVVHVAHPRENDTRFVFVKSDT